MPATYVKTGGSFSPVLQPYIKSSGSWVPVLNIWVRNGGSWSLAFTGFTASAAPNPADGTALSSTVDSVFCTATPTGGVGPFTYAWAYVSGDATISIVSPTSSTTVFRATGMAVGEIRSAVFSCVVTDTTTGISETTNNVSTTLENIS